MLDKTNIRFISWLQARNSYSLDSIQYLGKSGLSTLDDNSWLTGFIDAEGCFNCLRINDPRCKIGFSVSLRFILDQKNELFLLQKVKTFLGSGNIHRRFKVENMHRLVVRNRKSHEILIKYLDKYPLRSIKKVSYLRFCSILRYLLDFSNYPWTKKGLKKLERLIKNIKS